MRLSAAQSSSNVTTSEPDEPVPPGLRPKRKAASKTIDRLDPGQNPSKLTNVIKKSVGRTSKESAHIGFEREDSADGSVPLPPQMNKDEEKGKTRVLLQLLVFILNKNFNNNYLQIF